MQSRPARTRGRSGSRSSFRAGLWREANYPGGCGPIVEMLRPIIKERIETQQLSTCLENEMAAIQMYTQALDRHRMAHDQEVGAVVLIREMLMDHQEAAARLRMLVQRKDATYAAVGRVLGNSSASGAKPFVEDASLRALKTSEEGALNDYQVLARHPNVGAAVKNLIAPIITRQQKHIAQLHQLIERSE